MNMKVWKYPLVALMCLVIAILACGGDAPKSEVESGPAPTVASAPSCEVIQAELDGMTELARDEYLRSLHGFEILVVGTVSGVDSGSHVNLDGIAFDARFRLHKDQAVELQIGQRLEVTGIVEHWETTFGLTVWLEDAPKVLVIR